MANRKKMTGAQMVCESLLREGVEVMFGYPGGAILPFYQTLPQYPKLRHILVRHEQGAGHAADGYSRATGRVGVAVATSGPGATNLTTALATAQMDSSPMIAITGQVPRSAIGKDAFQETDVTGVSMPVTKHNYLVMETRDIPRIMKEAFYIARTGRPGPVLIDIPKDVQQEEAEFEYPDGVDLPGFRPVLDGHPAQIKKAAGLIDEAQRPLIIAGHGVIISRAYAELLDLAEKTGIPVITTLLGISGFPGDHPLHMGMPGMHGLAWNNLAIDEADVIVAIGMRFDDRVTGKVSTFAPRAKIVHIDIDPAEIGKNVKAHVPIVGDVKRVLTQLNQHVTARHDHPDRKEWRRRVDKMKKEHPSLRIRDAKGLLPQYVCSALSEVTHGDSIIVTGVGQHQMWAAQHYVFRDQGTFISSGGLGTMGFEIPAAMGAQVGRPDKTVWSVAGDGGFQMTLPELGTIAQEKIPVKFAILNNSFLGMVRQWQEIFYQRQYVATPLFSPDFMKLAEAYGMMGLRVKDKAGVGPAIHQAMKHDGPVIVEFVVVEEESVYPMIPPGLSVNEMIEEPEKMVAMQDSKEASS
ncbi:MAG: biosynthetic-type acetolactate synthase large subunit [Dehalococcoidia bacterium]|nr:biosynthetic-type acetolactate synthase large subunit [Dehalococcoidia bacterium]